MDLNRRPADYKLTSLSFLTSSKLRKHLKVLYFSLSYFCQFQQVLADFGKFFSHKFTHRFPAHLCLFYLLHSPCDYLSPPPFPPIPRTYFRSIKKKWRSTKDGSCSRLWPKILSAEKLKSFSLYIKLPVKKGVWIKYYFETVLTPLFFQDGFDHPNDLFLSGCTL